MNLRWLFCTTNIQSFFIRLAMLSGKVQYYQNYKDFISCLNWYIIAFMITCIKCLHVGFYIRLPARDQIIQPLRMKHSMLLHWELYIPGLDGPPSIQILQCYMKHLYVQKKEKKELQAPFPSSKARWVAVSMMPWVSASVVLLTMLVETTSYLGVVKKTLVVSDNLSARWDTTGWRPGIHDS